MTRDVLGIAKSTLGERGPTNDAWIHGSDAHPDRRRTDHPGLDMTDGPAGITQRGLPRTVRRTRAL
jgi:hypothetical protein